MNNLNMSMSGFESSLEYVVSNGLSAKSAYHKIRVMLKDNSIKTFREFADIDYVVVKSMKQWMDGYNIFELL